MVLLKPLAAEGREGEEVSNPPDFREKLGKGHHQPLRGSGSTKGHGDKDPHDVQCGLMSPGPDSWGFFPSVG